MIALITNYTLLPSRYRQFRVIYIIAIVVVIILGLISRKYSHLFPFFIAQNAGDILWATMVYLGFRFLLIHKSINIAILLSFAFCYGIEFSQLYQEDWINKIRHTTLGALVLGKGFLVVDLIRYTVGIIGAALLDKMLWKFTKHN
ncbi:DUF2809 domain-containing protein [Bacillus sp. FJAT-22090]|uniref:DUF2809 domain-containing protein n=1 Tax=Bacillus sp. FJAT-22090 TaxID=1581038 RepID=UPI0037C05196